MISKLYPPIEPFNSGLLKVSNIHQVYFEEVGNPKGKPVVFVHGGPGAGSSAFVRQYFDPQKWRVVLFDQRGSGRSKPHSELNENTTWLLVDDMETLRKHLHIDRWTVFGGSWGSTLALTYAVTHPACCLELILRGIFLLRRQEITWFYQQGASVIFPDAWETYLAEIPDDERDDLVAAYYKRLIDPDPNIRRRAAKAWSIWEARTSKLFESADLVNKFGDDAFADAFARIECHYFMNRGFFTSDNFLLENVSKIRSIPGIIVQGRYDMVCPMKSAWDLHRAWPEAELRVVADAGHSVDEPGIQQALIEATDRFGNIQY